ncbi:MAG: N-acetylmuramoyl-L-alanine amidase, partial [Christensenellaceae bacterium]
MIEMLLTKGSKRRKGKKLTRFTGVTIHNTGNTSKGANAKKNAQYQKNTENSAAVGWHITVDENETYLSIPIDEIAEHCGKRLGNDTT